MRCASTPQPDCTAIYCLPSTAKELGTAVIPELVPICHSTLPVFRIVRAELAIVGAAAEDQAARRGQQRPLIVVLKVVLPDFFTVVHVPGLHLTDVIGTVGQGHADILDRKP